MTAYSKVIHNPKPHGLPPNLNPVFKTPILLRLCAMRTADFNYELLPELIAQHPANKRDESRLLVLHRKEDRVEHRRFPDLLEFLRAGDVLVLNDSRVIPARLRGTNAKSGGKFEILLLEENAPNDWWTMLRPGKKARIGTQIVLTDASGAVTGIITTVAGTGSAAIDARTGLPTHSPRANASGNPVSTR